MTTIRKGFFNLLNFQKRTQYFTPEMKEELYTQYRDSLGLSKDLTFGATAFSDHEKNRLQDQTGFKTVIKKDADGNDITLDSVLKDTDSNEDAKKGVADTLKNVFALQPFYTRAKATYEEEIAQFQKQLKKVPQPYSVDVLRSALKETQENARKAIEAQQKTEKKQLEAAFNNQPPHDTFTETFKEALGVADTATIQKEMLAELEKKHKDQLKAFEDTAAENITKIDKASAKEKGNLIFTAQLEATTETLFWASDRKRMTEEIERVREENRRKQGMDDRKTTATIDLKKKTISAINPNDLNFIISITGKEIKKNNGRWELEMPPRFMAPLYYASMYQNPKAEWLTMAQAVRASGFDGIKLIVDFDDPDTLKVRAREAYEAALESGFTPDTLPPDNKVKGITLVDGKGQEIDPRTLFTPGELAILNGKAQKINTSLKDIGKNLTPITDTKKTQAFRKDIADGRNQAQPDVLAHEEEDKKAISTALNS